MTQPEQSKNILFRVIWRTVSRSFAIISLFLVIPLYTQAAILYLEPSQGQYHPGDTFMIEVRINTEGECVNAMEVYINFPPDILEAVDFSQGNSILTLWVKPPTIEPAAGIISFSGGIPGGYCGKILGSPGQGNLLGKAIIKIKNIGQKSKIAEIKFSDSSQILLNDGFGTPTKLTTKGAVFNILAEKPAVPQNQWQQEIKNDTIAPEDFKIELGQDPSVFDGKYFITFSTVDKQTGLDHYEVAEGSLPWEKASSPYLLKNQGLTSIIKVKAVDKAGNEKITSFSPPPKPLPADWIILIAVFILITAILGFIISKKFRQRIN